MKRGLALVLAAGMSLSLVVSGCASGQKSTASESAALESEVQESAAAESQQRSFTDSLGREFTFEEELTRVAVSGPLAQIAVFALAPDRLAGIALDWNKEAEQYLDTEYYHLPVLGQLYGGKGEMNLEEILTAAPQVIIDFGEPKKSAAEDLDALQEQIGIPFVHITGTLSTMDDAYRKLGELLGMEEEAERLAEYCASNYEAVLALAEGVEKERLLYVTGEDGLHVIPQGSYFAEVIDLLSDNIAVVDTISSKGSGNEVDMEQILNWNPDVIIFSDMSIYDKVEEMEDWKNISAIQTGRYYEVPIGPYNWLGFPPSVHRLLGMWWMMQTVYPEAADYDLYEKAAEYFDLFYHCELSREQYDALMAKSVGKLDLK